MKQKIEIQVEDGCDECVYGYPECKGNPVFLIEILEKYGISVETKHSDMVIQCPERLVPPDDDDD